VPGNLRLVPHVLLMTGTHGGNEGGMATAHAPGTIGPGDTGKHGRRAAVIAGVVLVCAAIAIPYGLHGVQRGGAPAAPATGSPTSSPTPAAHHRTGDDPALGSQGDLPSLLPSRGDGLRDGLHLRIGDITGGTLRRTPATDWQVMVRWDGRLQPLVMRGPLTLADGTSWVSSSGLLYTRIATDTPGRFHVFAWDPQGGTAYTPPALVATDLGRVCFNRDFTAFGGCRTTG
jgi:hypothetical protein